MDNRERKEVSVESTIKAPIEKVWDFWTGPEHITQWCNASDDWHAPFAENDPGIGGKFRTTMAAKDGSMSFDFEGVYNNVEKFKFMEYTIADGRRVKVVFTKLGDSIKITETFEIEESHTSDQQKSGWQSILDNFKKYTESKL